ncbi:hypothetical protein WJX73_004775 [Symbiochloris irregularis]|uniref:Uncharacterized protein n=1 Tax=Symbiochloris irregularis TaxID=706552 RepID=A0AAW1NN50_9CHLO
MLRFIEDRHSCIQRVVLKNSEGYYADDGEFVNLQQKHNFSLAHFGMLLGMLRSTLTELQVRHCADFFTLQALAAIACLPHLKVLRLEELRCRIDQCSLAELANLTQLEELSVTAEDSEHAWLVGMDAVPKQWAALKRLRKLELRGHRLLITLPGFLTAMPLTHLDVSFCKALDLSCLHLFTSLQVLALQGMNLVETPMGLADAMLELRKGLPRTVFSLSGLTALNLADNALSRVPPQISKLVSLQFLDLSGNARLQVTAPLTALNRLKNLQLVDMRGIHTETDLNYWSEAKCASMRHLSAFSKSLKRGYPGKVLLDLD